MFTIRFKQHCSFLLVLTALFAVFGCSDQSDSVMDSRNGSVNAFGSQQDTVAIEGILDVKPGSCVNPLNTKSQGVTPVAILGTEDFDVSEIDISTIVLEGVSPIRHSLEDVNQPGDPGDCPCSEDGPDGFMDLTLKFTTQEIVAALGTVTDREVLAVTVTGQLNDGTSFESSDCILILHGSIVADGSTAPVSFHD